MSHLTLEQIPSWQKGYRFQFEPSQQAHVILYPEGMIKLNETAAAIALHINNQNNIQQIIDLLKSQFGEIEAIAQDVLDYMHVAQQENWIKF